MEYPNQLTEQQASELLLTAIEPVLEQFKKTGSAESKFALLATLRHWAEQSEKDTAKRPNFGRSFLAVCNVPEPFNREVLDSLAAKFDGWLNLTMIRPEDRE